MAVPYNCCLGCTQVMTRQELSEQGCWNESGHGEVNPPDHCMMLMCYACPQCFPQPLEADCQDGLCVAQGEGCPALGEDLPPAASSQAIAASPQTFAGQSVRVQGNVLPGLGVCDGNCPAENCCDSAILIDGLVRLSGYPCELDLTWWSNDYCAETFHTLTFGGEGLRPGDRYELTGVVNAAGGVPWDPPTMNVVGIRLLEPEGLGGAFRVTVTDVSGGMLPTCTEQPWVVGDQGTIYTANSAGTVRIYAPFFSCFWTEHFWGQSELGTDFDAWIPVDCDGCCCDFRLTGEVAGDTIRGQYEHNDGQCQFIVTFQGTRLP